MDTDSERKGSEGAANQKSLQDSIQDIRNPLGNLSGADGGPRNMVAQR